MSAVADFDFSLPAELIASKPPEARDGGRMLVLATDHHLLDRYIVDLPSLVRDGDLWVINDTRVIPARLLGRKASGGNVELLLLEPAGEGRWHTWGKSNRPLKVGTEITIAEGFMAEVVARDGRALQVELHADDVDAMIEQHGHMPLPPYIDRPDCEADRARYQTVFARQSGAVAAPTAGLHLTKYLMETMRKAGAEFASVTLHVGPGTFQPVQCDKLTDHVMHRERYAIDAAVAAKLNCAHDEGRRIVCVGTTSLRTIETACHNGVVQTGSGVSQLFIHPGYRWRIADALLTNFHLPRSTLLMLVAAMAGFDCTMKAYQHAIAARYRFYSYGDAMFIGQRAR
ncbi:MAG: tRNA preQ1(34) S-adenosylmethionine ribosyltransferase-isomerase QueA [Mariprofundales bacterium]